MSVAVAIGTLAPAQVNEPVADDLEPLERSTRASGRFMAVAYLVALIVQDFGPTQRVLGRLGSNLALFVLPILVATHLPEIRAALRSPRLGRLFRGCLLFSYVTAIVSMFLLLTLPTSSRGEVLLLKAAKEVSLFGLWLTSILAGYVILKHHLVLTRKVLWALLLLCGLLLAYELTAPTNIFASQGLFHAGHNIQMRPRLLTLESSMAGTLFAGLGLGILIVERRRAYRAAAVLLASSGIVLVQSKGSIATWSIAFAVGYLISLLRGSWRRSLFSPLLAACAVIVGALLAAQVTDIVVSGLQRDRDQSTSSATRSAYLLSARISLLDQPLGGGFGGNIVSAQRWLSEARDQLTPKFRGGALSEIDGLLRSDTDRAFSPKSLPVTLVYWGGLGGVLLFLFIGLSLVRASFRSSIAGPWPLVVAAFILLATFSYVSSLYEYEITLLVGGLLALEGASDDSLAAARV